MDAETVGDLTILEAIGTLEAAGFKAGFHVVPGGSEPLVACDSCGVTMAATAIEVLQLFRLEGDSDPADEAVVAGVRCLACGCRGTLVATYGPMADPADADVVAALVDSRRRPSGSLPT
ncbi:MAG: hypothetical protein ACRDZ7_10200 [Acidimicrobiia bacterium]